MVVILLDICIFTVSNYLEKSLISSMRIFSSMNQKSQNIANNNFKKMETSSFLISIHLNKRPVKQIKS